VPLPLSRGAKKILKETEGNLKEKEDKPIEISYLETPDYILEQIKLATLANDATLAQDTYVIYNKAKNTINYENDFEFENKIYKPIKDDLLDKGAITLPSGVEEYGTTDKLIKEITQFFFDNFEVPKFYEKFLPYLCLFYWVYDKFPFIPYLHFVGRTTTGKTTAMEVFGSICYKPIDASGAITLSPIFRTSSTWRGTLLLDEFDTSGDSYKELIAFLKSGTGDRRVLRTEGEGIKSVKAHIAKSPKVFTSERPVYDAGLQSRTITVMMNESTRPIPLYRLRDFNEQANNLRNKLLLWRLRNLNKIDLKDIKFGFEELRMFDKRVQQVVTPIYYLADKNAKKEILEFATEHQKETLRERRESLDGIIFEIILEKYENHEDITVSDIHDKIGNEKLTAKRIGNIIRKVLQFDIVRVGHENVSQVILERQDNKIKSLCLYYGLALSLAGVASVASVANGEIKLTKKEEKSLDEIEEQLPF
jgi:hypothetical protein